MSSPLIREMVPPEAWTSSAISSCAFAIINWAQRYSTVERFAGGMSRHSRLSNAALAAATALSRSAVLPMAARATTSPVAGLTTFMYSPSAGSRRWPSMINGSNVKVQGARLEGEKRIVEV